jgi:hypothetical protein
VEIHHGTGNTALAKVIEHVLEAEDIPCVIKTDSGIASAPLAIVPPKFSIWVHREDAHRASQIIQDAGHVSDANHDERMGSEYQNLRWAIRPRSRPTRAPLPIIGGTAILLLGAGLFDISQGGGLWLLLLPLAALAFFVALRSRL